MGGWPTGEGAGHGLCHPLSPRAPHVPQALPSGTEPRVANVFEAAGGLRLAQDAAPVPGPNLAALLPGTGLDRRTHSESPGGGGRDCARDRASGPQKNALKPWQKQCWCIPPQANATFVHKREDVLEVYRHPADDRCPVVCVSDTSCLLVSETRGPRRIATRRDWHYTPKHGSQPASPQASSRPWPRSTWTGASKARLCCEPRSRSGCRIATP